ncbi:hypothetical protein SLS53_008582 [Cytospora paraplurivora]|uniref:Uncharacterized protein n=1 Tax=Cytospora paraplurivora TaxID=2898453 RepID=A0AAN9YCP0_9PEZI
MGLFKKSKGKGTDTKPPPPKFQWDYEDGEVSDVDQRLDRSIMNRLGTTMNQTESTERLLEEDINANKLFENVPGYNEKLKKAQDQQKKPSHYRYPPESLIMGPGWLQEKREAGEDPAAEELFKEVNKDKHAPKGPDAGKELRRTSSAVIKAEAAMMALFSSSGERTVRYEGEDPKAEKLFEPVPEFRRNLRPASENPEED